MKLLSILFFLFYTTSFTYGILSIGTTCHPLSPYFIGFNGRSTEGPSWDDPSFVRIVRDLNPVSFRYPAGSQANLWDWRTGSFIPESGKKAAYPFTIRQCVDGIPADTRLVYVINMAYPTPTTGISMLSDEATLASEATLQAKIADMIDAMKAFERCGRVPELIELGNEFYFQNEHAGVYGKNPQLYLAHAHTIASVLKEHYPEISIMLIATKNGTKGRDEWNKAIYDAINQNDALSSLIDGVVQHHYVKDGFGWTEPVIDQASVQRAIAEGWLYIQEQQSSLEEVPESMKIWLTEYGATKKNMDGSWGAGLRAAIMTLGWLDLGRKIESVFWQHITDDPNVIRKTDLTPGPAAIALKELIYATRHKTAFRKMIFSDNPSLTTTRIIPSLHGYLFSNDEGEESLLLLNLGENEYRDSDLQSLFSDKEFVSGVCLSSSNPYEQNASMQNGIVRGEISHLSDLCLKPFSITTLSLRKKQAAATAIKSNDNPFVYVAAEKKIRLFTPGELRIYDQTGILTLLRKTAGPDLIDLSGLSEGSYILRFIRPGDTDRSTRIFIR